MQPFNLPDEKTHRMAEKRTFETFSRCRYRNIPYIQLCDQGLKRMQGANGSDKVTKTALSLGDRCSVHSALQQFFTAALRAEYEKKSEWNDNSIGSTISERHGGTLPEIQPGFQYSQFSGMASPNCENIIIFTREGIRLSQGN